MDVGRMVPAGGKLLFPCTAAFDGIEGFLRGGRVERGLGRHRLGELRHARVGRGEAVVGDAEQGSRAEVRWFRKQGRGESSEGEARPCHWKVRIRNSNAEHLACLNIVLLNFLDNDTFPNSVRGLRLCG